MSNGMVLTKLRRIVNGPRIIETVWNPPCISLCISPCISLECTEAVSVRHVVDRGPAVSVGPRHPGVGVARLVPGAVDVGVAEGEVLVLVLAVVLGGHHRGHISTGWLADNSCL